MSVAGPGAPLLEVEELTKHFPAPGGGTVRAVDGVTLSIARGETLALVGESGCGKTTLARLLLRLLEPTSGRIRFAGRDVLPLGSRALREWRRRVQIVFQDPYASLDPRHRVEVILAEPFAIRRRGREGAARLRELLEVVGLDAEVARRFPHELSGGERQRVAIARAIALEPELLVLDEPVTALDVSIQAQVLNLLADIQARRELAYLLVAHDLAVVRHLADRVAVMHLGRLVETGAVGAVFERAAHPYTQALLSAAPVPNPEAERRRRRIVLDGDAPSPTAPPSGCRFRTRCWKAEAMCTRDEPALEERGQGHPVACHFASTGTGAG